MAALLLAPLLAWSGPTRLPPGGLARTVASGARPGLWMCAEDAVPATAPSPAPAPTAADVLLMDAMEALRNDDVDLAIATMSKARAQTEKDRNAPVGSERATLLALVQARVDAAEAKRNLATSSKRECRAFPPPTRLAFFASAHASSARCTRSLSLTSRSLSLTSRPD